MKHLIKFLSAAVAIVIAGTCIVSAKNDGKMNFKVSNDGKVTVNYAGKEYIEPSTIGLIIKDGKFVAPVSAKDRGGRIDVDFGCCKAVVDKKIREDGSVRLSLASISEEVDAFFFGPFACTDVKEIGEFIGAAWRNDGGVACIRALNPKTQAEWDIYKNGKMYTELVPRKGNEITVNFTNDPDFVLPSGMAAGMSVDGKPVLSCGVRNMTKPFKIYGSFYGMSDCVAEAIPAPDGCVEGAAIILTCAGSSDALLSQIEKIELEEGLVHPVINGEWAKTSPHATDAYLVFGDGDIDAQIRMAERAGISCVYFGDPFESWGTFGISKRLYPGGMPQFREFIKKAKSHGVNAGFHTLSAFIHPHDPFVTPVPKDLRAVDPVALTAGISADDTEIHIAEALNYEVKLSLNTIRIGDELIRFGEFDKASCTFTGCQRGAFGTMASAHAKGDTVTHLIDYSYGTFFPSASLTVEMADNIGKAIKESGILRMSFDGIGGKHTGHGSYTESVFTDRILKAGGDDVINDASAPGHYRWDAHTYFNWGEPWYDYQRRGGMYNYRVRNFDLFDRNLIPRMLGWYGIFGCSGRIEPTLPETVEFMLSRTVAWNAGTCFSIHVPESDKLNSYLDMMRLWQDFKLNCKVPQEILEEMQEERSDWHLEKKDGKWLLSEMAVTDYDLTYCDHAVITESGTTGYMSSDNLTQTAHRSNVVIDRNTPDRTEPSISEPFHCRIRVGTPLDHGKIHNVAFSGGWYGAPIISFKVLANAGEYLEYRGGKTLYRYDKDYNLIDSVEGEGKEVVIDGDGLTAVTVDYDIVDELPGEKPMVPMLKYIRTKRVYEL